MSFFDYEGKQIFYKIVKSQKENQNLPLLVLNGIMMNTDSWIMLEPKLSKNRDLIFLDFIDQGKSDGYEENYSHDLQVDLVVEFISFLKMDKINLFGISYGALIALQVAIKKPEIIEKLLVFNASAYTSPWLKDIGRGWVGAANTDDPMDFYHVSIPYIYSHFFYNFANTWFEARKSELAAVFTADFKERMKRLIISSENYDIREKISGITVPTMIVSSEYDYITPKSESKYLKNNIKSSVYFEMAGSGHASMYEKAEEFMILIEGFLNYDS